VDNYGSASQQEDPNNASPQVDGTGPDGIGQDGSAAAAATAEVTAEVGVTSAASVETDSAELGSSSLQDDPAADADAHLAGPLLVYSVLRVALIAALTAILAIFMPLIVALMFAIVLQLPLAWILFAGPRRKVNDAMARKSSRRRAERQRLQSALSGDEPLP
jgi:hypothetical protein